MEFGIFLVASLSQWIKLGSYKAKAHGLALSTSLLGKSMTSVFPSARINIKDTRTYNMTLVLLFLPSPC